MAHSRSPSELFPNLTSGLPAHMWHVSVLIGYGILHRPCLLASYALLLCAGLSQFGICTASTWSPAGCGGSWFLLVLFLKPAPVLPWLVALCCLCTATGKIFWSASIHWWYTLGMALSFRRRLLVFPLFLLEFHLEATSWSCIFSGTYWSTVSLLPLWVQSQLAGIGVKPSVHCQEFPCVGVRGLCLLFLVANQTSRVTDDQQGIRVNTFGFVFDIQLTYQDLPYSV